MKYVLYLSLFSSVVTYSQEVVSPPPPPSEPTLEVEVQEEVYDFVEVQPEFPGGMEKMMKFLSINFKYPQIDKENGIEGRVFVSFVVEKDGEVSNVKVIKGVSETLDAEAIRIVKLMPKWKPGTQNGKAVRVRYRLPVKARLR